MRAVDLIERKRDGGRLTADEIRWLIAGYVQDRVPDYQLSALLMAIVFNGLDDEELAVWTEAMLASGERLDLSRLAKPRADKHSTGGVGDKVSIPLGPMVAACGIAMPMISGRGLGHTGGTLDKLEAIPGFRTALDLAAIDGELDDTGLVFAGQTETLVPADRLMYALRDATATVPQVGLMASSIMSKKLAEDLDALVLDIKLGRGAFLDDADAARGLAKTMVGLGRAHGVDTAAMITDMAAPLGREVGNANEIAESITLLRGGGPPDLGELVFALGAHMLLQTNVANDEADARRRLRKTIDSGAALDVFARVIERQGGDPRILDDPTRLPQPRYRATIEVDRGGIVQTVDALAVGRAAGLLGAGRATKNDTIDPSVGITVLVKPGDTVDAGAPFASLGYNDRARCDEAMAVLAGAVSVGDDPVERGPLILETVNA